MSDNNVIHLDAGHQLMSQAICEAFDSAVKQQEGKPIRGFALVLVEPNGSVSIHRHMGNDAILLVGGLEGAKMLLLNGVKWTPAPGTSV